MFNSKKATGFLEDHLGGIIIALIVIVVLGFLILAWNKKSLSIIDIFT